MSIYQNFVAIASKYISKHTLFKYGFNWSPMYRRSTGRIVSVSKDLLHVKVKLPISYKNRNYVNSIFGGSLFSAVDPIHMIQLINILGDDYIVWDKSAQIFFKRPAREGLIAEFVYTTEEIEAIKERVRLEKEIEIVKPTTLTDPSKSKVYCEVRKTIYVADKLFYKNKRSGKK